MIFILMIYNGKLINIKRPKAMGPSSKAAAAVADW